MKHTKFIILSGVIVLLGGCDRQTKINGEKIDALSQKVAQLEQQQAAQTAAIATQLTALTPALDKINYAYFEKSHEDAFFFHTNTLYLLLTVDRKIGEQLEAADAERQAEHAVAYYYHTNQTDTMYFCVAQVVTAMEGEETRIVDKVNAETRQQAAALNDELVKQIKLSAPDAAETARRQETAADVAQIKSDLELIKARLGITNPPARP